MCKDFDDEYLTLKSCQTPINTLETKRETENYNHTYVEQYKLM